MKNLFVAVWTDVLAALEMILGSRTATAVCVLVFVVVVSSLSNNRRPK